MFCILVYDINEKRVNKVLKKCREYLNWTQNSVLEGNLTDAQLYILKISLQAIINEAEDSIVIYKMRSDKYLKKDIMGIDKSDMTSNLI